MLIHVAIVASQTIVAFLEILIHITLKWLVFQTPLSIDAPAQGNPSEFLDET